MVWVTVDQKRLITSNVASATMTIIEKSAGGGRGRGPQSDWAETIVAVGRGAEGFDVSPDGKEIWAANAQDGTISILDFAGKNILTRARSRMAWPGQSGSSYSENAA